MKSLLYTLPFFSLISCKTSDSKNNIITERINFILNLKRQVANESWKEFGKRKYEGPLFYFHDDKTYIFFADETVKKNLFLNSKENAYYELEKRYDSIPFHMEIQIEFDSINSNPILLNHPIEFFSSPEETQKTIPSITSTEIWSTMVIHEMFHHFQFNNRNFRDYMKIISEVGYDNRDLKKLIHSDSIFKKKIETENDLLLKILESNNNDSINTFINNFIDNRTERRNDYSKKNKHFIQVEDAFEKMEGSARYLEYQSMLQMQNLANTKHHLIIENDSSFNNYNDFKKFNISNEDFEYLQIVSHDYYYTLGFNLLRVFDKLNIKYQEIIFDIPNKPLTDLLIEYRK